MNASIMRPEEKVRIDSSELMYVIYTSGSTGMPKGVMISHQAVCNHTYWMQQRFPINSEDCILQQTSLSFDVSVWEIFAPLLHGAKLVLAPLEGVKDLLSIVEAIADQKVTVLQLVPSLLKMLLEEGDANSYTSLQHVFCGGEEMPLDLPERFFALTNAELVNMYGPTESCIDATYWVCKRGDRSLKIPIGRPITNTQIYILDKYQQLVPIGIPGEIYIGGHGLADGYLGRPDLTNERFVHNPFSNTPGARLYKTGDRGRYLADGRIEFLGRIDHQVKIRGFRIELGEIEAELVRHPAIREAVVVPYNHDKQLLAYVVLAAGKELSLVDIRHHLQRTLPEYMIPAGFAVLSEIPLTPNGKIDRLALPVSTIANVEVGTAYIAPRSLLETRVADIWTEVLRVKHIGIQDNFFGCGGNSLLAVNVIARLRSIVQIDISLRDLFENPTIESLALILEKKQLQVSEHSGLTDGEIDADRAQNILADFSNLSDEEIEKLLEKLLSAEDMKHA